MKFEETVNIQKHYKDASNDIEQIKIEGGSGTRIDNIYYYVIPDEEIMRLQALLKEHLELK
jgi:polyisoprenyl-teichoic acid--peptidoglycan teichoic acid transferase